MSPEDRKQVIERVAASLPEVETVGIVSARPFSDGRSGLTPFTREAGGAAVLKLQVVEVDGGAIQSLLGDASRPASNSFDLVVDAHAAVRIAAATKRKDVIGLALYDGAGLAYTIRGIVKHVPYTTGSGSAAAAGYVAMGESTPVLHLVMRGGLTERRISTLDLRLGDRKVELRELHRLDALATRMQARFGARIAFALATALVCAGVALVAVLAIVLLEVRRELRALAIRSALGASTAAMVRVALTSILWSIGLGTVLAIGACVLLASPAQGAWFGAGDTSMLAVWLVAPLPVLLCAVCGAWLVRLELARQPVRKLLHEA